MTKDSSKCADLEAKKKELDQIIEQYRHDQGPLIPVLHEAQRIFGYLPFEVQLQVSEGLGIPLAEVYGVVTFYTGFSIKPKGKYKINVCLGTACYVKGAEAVLDKFRTVLSLQMQETVQRTASFLWMPAVVSAPADWRLRSWSTMMFMAM